MNPNSNGAPVGNGGRGGNNRGSDQFKDQTNPTPVSANRSPDGAEPQVAPDSKVPPVIRKLQDLLKDGKFTPNVEKDLGMTRDEAEQFVKKFENRKQPGPATPGQEIKVKPGEEKAFDKNYKAPDFQTQATVRPRNERSGTSLPEDTRGGLSEGSRSSPPPELRKKFEAYNKSLSSTKSGTTSSAKPASKP